MNPQLLSSLAADRRRDLAASAARRAPSGRAPRRAHRAILPRFHVTWTRTTLAAVADRRRARSLVIVISATRTQ